MPDVIVIGGGVIGLSIAWELAGHGFSVRVLEQGSFGQEASWAGAGMLPPGRLAGARSSESRLRGLAHEMWPDWSQKLTSYTGMDNGYLRCGGLEVRFPNSPPELTDLQTEIRGFQAEGVAVEAPDLSEIRSRFPAINRELAAGYYLPEFCQVRNPRHLQTLQAGCAMRGVELVDGSPVRKIVTDGGRIRELVAGDGVHRAAEFIIANGAWASELLSQINVSLTVEPVKGQIVLLRSNPPPFRSVIQIGREYLVPRSDGRILVGSTEERSGFDKRNTAQAIADLIAFAGRLVPALREAQFEKSWAGLRPYSASGLPFIGRLPQLTNACVAAGHSRNGLHWSPVTAVLIRQLLLKQPVQLPEECRI